MKLITVQDLYDNGNIDEIIISNKEKKQGIIRLKGNNYWIPIKKNHRLSMWIKKQVKGESTPDLTQNIISHCCKQYTPLKMNYHQSVVYNSYSLDDVSWRRTYYIIDFLNGEFVKVTPDMYIVRQPCLAYRSIPIITKNDADINFVNNLMTRYVSADHISAYRKLCQSIFVQPNPTLFRDNECINRHYRLYEWLKRASVVLFGPNIYLAINDDTYDHITKKNFTSNIRFVTVYPGRISEQQMLRKIDASKYNIIIIDQNLPNKYNDDNMEISDICLNTLEKSEEKFMHMLWWSLTCENDN